MELLLNLVWVATAMAAFCALALRQRDTSRPHTVPYFKALLALACVLVLLFPVVSASDDLHPSQAMLEEVTKRFQQLSTPIQHSHNLLHDGVVPALFAVCILCTLVTLHMRQPIALEARIIRRARLPRDGRSPPSN